MIKLFCIEFYKLKGSPECARSVCEMQGGDFLIFLKHIKGFVLFKDYLMDNLTFLKRDFAYNDARN